jgi:hypothetical protein
MPRPNRSFIRQNGCLRRWERPLTESSLHLVPNRYRRERRDSPKRKGHSQCAVRGDRTKTNLRIKDRSDRLFLLMFLRDAAIA